MDLRRCPVPCSHITKQSATSHMKIMNTLAFLRSAPALPLAACLALTVQHLSAASVTWTGGGTSDNWGQAGTSEANWSPSGLPAFGNTLDVVFYAPGAQRLTTTSMGGSTGIGRTVRSLTFNDDADASVNLNTSSSFGSTSPRPLQFDTDATGPGAFAEIVVTSGAAGTFEIGAPSQGSVILNDNLKITHNGSGLLTIRRPITGTSYGILKEGTGALALSAANTYAGPTTINGGMLTIGNGGTAGSLASTAITNNAVLIFNRSNDATNSANISGTGSVTQQGVGTLTFSGIHTYSGVTAITGGTLAVVAGGSAANSDVTVADGMNLTVMVPTAGLQWTCKSLTNGWSNLRLDFGTTTVPSTNLAPLQVNGDVTFLGTPSLTVNAYSLPSGPGAYPLMSWTGTLAGTAPASATVPPNLTLDSPAVSVVGNTLYLNVLAVANNPQPLTWIAGNGIWDSFTANWMNSAGTNTTYQDYADNVVFDDMPSGTGPFSVDLYYSVLPKSLTVSNATKDYAFSAFGGKISGTTGLTKNGAGTLTLGTGNDYSGPTLVSGGTLALNAVGAIQKGAITVESGATLREYSVAGDVIGNSVDVIVNASGLYDLEKNETVGSLAGSGQVVATWTGAGAAWNLTAGAGNKSTVFSGSLSDTTTNNLVTNSAACVLSFTKSGTGTLTLSGTNHHTGATAITGGTLLLSNSLALQVSPLNYNNLGGTLSFGALTFATIGGLNGSQSLPASSLTSLTLNPVAGVSATYSGVINDGAGTLALTKTGLGSQVLAGTNTYTSATTVSAGTLLVNGLLGSGVVSVAGSGTLGGNGTLLGSVALDGTLAPGTSIGTLTVSNTLTLGAGSTTLMEIDQASASNDAVVGLTSVTYSGTLTVTNLAGTFQLGESYKLFSAGSYTGNFSHFNLPGLDPGLRWAWNPSAGTLSVEAIPQTPTNISFTVSGGNLELTWPGSHLGWIAQSNSVSVADASAWFDITGSQTVTNLSLPINPGLTNVFFRLRYP